MSLQWLCVQIEISVFLNLHFWFYILCRLEVFIYCSIHPRDVAMIGGGCFNNCWLLRPDHMRKFPLFISFRKVLLVGLKEHPWIYWINSVFVLSLVMIDITRCITIIEMGMSYRPSVLFLCPFKIGVFPLRILISFLSNMATQSSSHSCHKEISEALFKSSNICAF